MFTLNESSPSFCFRQFERELKLKKKEITDKKIKKNINAIRELH